MKNKLFFALLLLFSIFIFSCGSDNIENNNSQVTEPQDVIEEIVEENPDIIYEDDLVEVLDDEDEESQNEEYLRSINQISNGDSVSKKEFNEDKQTILEMISELAIIMETGDCNAWLKYIDKESQQYYSNPVNLRNVQRKLPNKLIELKTIDDYFKYVFIPSRKNKQIDEIRYTSKTYVKAVEVNDDNSTTVYYYFSKNGDKWLVHIPEL